MNRLNNKALLGGPTLPLAGLGLALWHSGRLPTAVHTEKAVKRTRALTVFCEEIRTFISGYHGRGMFHLPERMDGAGEAPMGRPGGEMGQTVASVAMAAEVKALARSSAESAGEIAGEVETIQAHIGTTAVDVETVTGIVERLAHINAAIALAAGEQSNAAAADGRSNGNEP